MKRYVQIALIFSLVLVYKQSVSQTQTNEKVIITRKASLNYLLWIPKAHSSDKDKSFPLLIFLHGSGERGENLELVKTHGPPSFVENRPDFPFITVSPQCPNGTWWDVENLQAMLDQVRSKYKIDSSRIYLTGLSMGGFGSWAWACKYPSQFAAIAPICGGGDIQFAGALKNTPIWAFHGESDPIVPVKRTIEMVEAVNKNGGSARMTIYPEVGHDSWIKTYNNPELYTWLIKHTLTK